MTTTPTPAPDAAEIEALIARIENDGPFFDCIGEPVAELEVDIINALRSLSRPVEVTDAMVERALIAENEAICGDPECCPRDWDDLDWRAMRAALTAALGGRDDG